MPEENLVDIFTDANMGNNSEDNQNDLVTATVESNEESGYVKRVHLDIKRPRTYHFTSDGIEDKIEEDEYAGKNVFNETEDATVTPSGSKVDINIPIPEEQEPKYKSALMINMPYDVFSGYAKDSKTTIYASLPPKVDVNYAIVEWFERVTGSNDYNLGNRRVSDCLDEIAYKYELIEQENMDLKNNLVTEKATNMIKFKDLQIRLDQWKKYCYVCLAVMTSFATGWMLRIIYDTFIK